MTNIAQDEPRPVTGGVDTHKDVHVAAILDALGGSSPPRRSRRPATATGACSGGSSRRASSRQSASRGAARGAPASPGSSPSAASPSSRSTAPTARTDGGAGSPTPSTPKPPPGRSSTVKPPSRRRPERGPVEAVRQPRMARSGAMKARTAAANQLHSLCDTAPRRRPRSARRHDPQEEGRDGRAVAARRGNDRRRVRQTGVDDRRPPLARARRRGPRALPAHQGDPR